MKQNVAEHATVPIAARAMARVAVATLVFALLAVLSVPLPAVAAKKKQQPAPGYAQRPEVEAFIAELAASDGFNRAALKKVFAAARFQPKIIAAMQRPLVEPPKWYEYAPRFLSDARIDGGVAYWEAHSADLARAEEVFGVPSEIVVAILGVETFYGRNMGSYRALDALSTLAFDYPRRAAFFRGELRQFLLLTRDLERPAQEPMGSFAGALGMPQFMPSSYRDFAVDFDNDGRIDLWTSAADIIGSVANYLARHDWQRGQPVLLPAAVQPVARDAVLRKLDGGMSERRPLAAWSDDGVAVTSPPADLAPDPVGILLLEENNSDGEDAASLWIACDNFYVLTRYNRSRLYAAAVWQLAQAIKSARAQMAH